MLLNQVHSNKFSLIDKKYKFNKKKLKGDALITSVNNVAIGVLTADCVPILIYDQKLKIISVIHAGWKSTYKNIVKKVVKFFLKNGSKTKDLYAVVGPSITEKNYEVQKDFKDKFLKKGDVTNYKVIKIPSVYPIYRKDYEIHLKETEEYFAKIKNFFSIGRQGQFYYGDIDQMIRIGFNTADKIIKQ